MDNGVERVDHVVLKIVAEVDDSADRLIDEWQRFRKLLKTGQRLGIGGHLLKARDNALELRQCRIGAGLGKQTVQRLVGGSVARCDSGVAENRRPSPR